MSNMSTISNKLINSYRKALHQEVAQALSSKYEAKPNGKRGPVYLMQTEGNLDISLVGLPSKIPDEKLPSFKYKELTEPPGEKLTKGRILRGWENTISPRATYTRYSGSLYEWKFYLDKIVVVIDSGINDTHHRLIFNYSDPNLSHNLVTAIDPYYKLDVVAAKQHANAR